MLNDAPSNTTSVRAALVSLLKNHGVEDHDWSSIGVWSAHGRGETLYVVITGCDRAKAAMWLELDRLTGQTQGLSEAGIWVLSADQASILCQRHLSIESK